jgi:hypothetical protein
MILPSSWKWTVTQCSSQWLTSKNHNFPTRYIQAIVLSTDSNHYQDTWYVCVCLYVWNGDFLFLPFFYIYCPVRPLKRTLPSTIWLLWNLNCRTKSEHMFDSFPLFIKFKSSKLKPRSVVKCSVNGNSDGFHAFGSATICVSYYHTNKHNNPKFHSLLFFKP